MISTVDDTAAVDNKEGGRFEETEQGIQQELAHTVALCVQTEPSVCVCIPCAGCGSPPAP